jgi:hypothetical protein
MLSLLSGCSKELTFESMVKGLFQVNPGSSGNEKDLNLPLYDNFEQEKSKKETLELEERFSYKTEPYTGLVDKLWETEGFYRNKEEGLSEKELMIDFYLFMEYHKDTQRRNLQFPEFLQKDLLLIEALFVKRALAFIEEQELKEYEVLRDDMVTMYRNMYREELLNILYEGKQQVNVLERMPNILDRYNSELVNVGLRDKLKAQLGVPDTVVARGMGLDLITLYNDFEELPEGDTKELAIILTMEMRLSGINMRLERFFHVTNSLDGLDTDLVELRKDAELIPAGGSLAWSKDRMIRSIDYLESVYLFYKGETKYDTADQIFIDLQTREDFYALGMLSKNIKQVMDKEDYWEEVEDIRKLLVEERYLGTKNEK